MSLHAKRKPLIGESLISERWYATYIYSLNTIKKNMVMETSNVVAAKKLHNRLWQCNVEVLAYSITYGLHSNTELSSLHKMMSLH